MDGVMVDVFFFFSFLAFCRISGNLIPLLCVSDTIPPMLLPSVIFLSLS